MSNPKKMPLDFLQYMKGLTFLVLGELVALATFFILTGGNVDDAGRYTQQFGGIVIAFGIIDAVLPVILPWLRDWLFRR